MPKRDSTSASLSRESTQKLEPMMRHVLTIMVCLFGVASAQAHQHQHAVSSPEMIDGSKNPELIPDAVAHRLFLLNVSVPANSTENERKTQSVHLAKLKLNVRDYQVILTALAAFRSQYDQWIARWNQQAEIKGRDFDPTVFLQQREDIVQATRDELQRSLSTDGMQKFNTVVQQEKRAMKVPAN